MENKWKETLRTFLKNEIQLKEVSEYLKTLRASDVTQEEVRDFLNSLRENKDELTEDRILEVLDIVEGYCNPDYRVW